MNRDRSISASNDTFARRCAVAATVAAALALSTAYALFCGICALMLAFGWYA